MIRVEIPVAEQTVRELKVGDEVALYGTIVTARDAGHKLMVEKRPDFIEPYIREGAIYHCGPVMKQTGKQWQVVAAGPTTSIREEPYEANVIENYGVRLIIGKGGMGADTLAACRKFGAVYLHAVGGAAVLAADSVKQVSDVFMLKEFGVPEAFWICEVAGFKAIVTMDAHGNSLHDQVQNESESNFKALLGK